MTAPRLPASGRNRDRFAAPDPIPTADLDRLEALAEEATPGPWRLGEGNLDHWAFRGDTTIARAQLTENAAYIAACDPATIRRLIAAARSGLDVDWLARVLHRLHPVGSLWEWAVLRDGVLYEQRGNSDEFATVLRAALRAALEGSEP